MSEQGGLPAYRLKKAPEDAARLEGDSINVHAAIQAALAFQVSDDYRVGLHDLRPGLLALAAADLGAFPFHHHILESGYGCYVLLALFISVASAASVAAGVPLQAAHCKYVVNVNYDDIRRRPGLFNP